MKLLRREGDKYRYRERIINLFPRHTLYIEGFFGTGSIFFAKPLARYNILNDNSKFIYKFFYILRRDPALLYKRIREAIIYDRIINENQDKIEYMVLRSLYSIYATCSLTIGLRRSNAKRAFMDMIRTYKSKIKEMIECAVFTSRDIFNFLSVLAKSDKVSSTFVYLDPPYSISKGRLDDNKGWDLDSLETLIIEMKKYDWQFAISEFNDSEVLELLFKHNLYVNYIARSTGVASRFGHTKYEILGTSYKTNKSNIKKNHYVQLEMFSKYIT
ncbi:DNA adenine methylase (plasmid) [Borrelia miyamotoi]|uniref:site-specific DNA-methyltransferase (adenine-specific) n=2 Tax=Borrelia miyamotoi TaxID=47466 RepID=A0AAQ3CND8_9SPIR|nr:DNA adenine methylase [Borrelia miyamotoi]ATQ15318.1 DNA adenine methylase [Borrelia miyamotoi]ATQ19161.1 DNA adenine methylase [Borrelia miyamotoi]WCL22373.1 DNA adenine methylase [Borrelia miyamotoi]WDE70637.1 DNA adenine methylase [Borrelia miyamotoi]WDE71952.1 DNA adenine methylase [Borrelia miyamotoi]